MFRSVYARFGSRVSVGCAESGSIIVTIESGGPDCALHASLTDDAARALAGALRDALVFKDGPAPDPLAPVETEAADDLLSMATQVARYGRTLQTVSDDLEDILTALEQQLGSLK